MALDFSPQPVAAPTARRIWAHACTEARLILRNGEQAILAVVIPLAVLCGSLIAGDRLGLPFSQAAPSTLALVIWSSGLTTLAIATGFERRYNVLERLSATPLGRSGILAGKGLSIALITLGQVCLLSVLAVVLGWRPHFSLASLLASVVVAALAMGAFVGLALAISGSLRPEATLAVANLLYLTGMPLGILLPLKMLPSWAQSIVALTPTSALGETLRAAASGQAVGWPVAIAALWCAVAGTLAWKVFRWTS